MEEIGIWTHMAAFLPAPFKNRPEMAAPKNRRPNMHHLGDGVSPKTKRKRIAGLTPLASQNEGGGARFLRWNLNQTKTRRSILRNRSKSKEHPSAWGRRAQSGGLWLCWNRVDESCWSWGWGWGGNILGGPSILSRIPSFQETIKIPRGNSRFLKRTMVGESIPRNMGGLGVGGGVGLWS